MDTVSVAIAATSVTLVVTLFAMVLFIKKREAKYLPMELKAKELEKQIHFNETKFLEQKNRTEVAYRDEQRLLRNSSHQEGFEHGLAEGKKDHLIEITNLKAEHRSSMLEERDRSIAEARTQARAEFELQNKLFSVAIRPYVKIEKDSGFISDEHKSYIGYQYQLLINGIPAFQPHVVVEQTDVSKEINEAKLKLLTNIALDAAKVAAELYLSGASPSVLKMGSPVLEKVTK